MSASVALPPLPGVPDIVDDVVSQYATVAAAIEAAAQSLESHFAHGRALALDATHERHGEAVQALDRARERAAEISVALREYVIVLRAVHARARSHEVEYTLTLVELGAARERYELAVDSLSVAVEPAAVALAQAHQVAAAAALHAAREAAERVQASYRDALDQATIAADAAATRIEAAAVAGAEGASSLFDAAVSAAIGALSAAAHAARDVWDTAVDAAVAVALAVAAAAHQLMIAAAALWLYGHGVGAELLTYALLLALGAVTFARDVSEALMGGTLDALGFDANDRLRLAVTLLMGSSVVVQAYVYSRIANESAKPTPEVREFVPQTPRQAHTVEALDKAPDSPDDLMVWQELVDTAGGKDQTVIDIAEVEIDGERSWIVTLPSTQDWVGLHDQAPVNDLDADLMLVAFPWVRTQYQRAVEEAMAQAGIQQGEPVLMQGWSLGGIISSSMAAQGAGGYTYAGVLAAGSPIDHIHTQVPTLQVKHHNDPVHQVDGVVRGTPSPGSMEIWDGPRSGLVFSDIKTGNVIGHDIGDYADTMRDHLERGNVQAITDFFEPVIDFDAINTPGADVTITHQQFAFSE